MRLLILGFALVACAQPAAAETVVYSAIDQETEVYLQRGLQWPDYACYQWTVADMIWRYGVDPDNLYVTFDDPSVDGIAVGAGDSGFHRTCENGVLMEWDAGDAMVIHEFH